VRKQERERERRREREKRQRERRGRGRVSEGSNGGKERLSSVKERGTRTKL